MTRNVVLSAAATLMLAVMTIGTAQADAKGDLIAKLRKEMQEDLATEGNAEKTGGQIYTFERDLYDMLLSENDKTEFSSGLTRLRERLAQQKQAEKQAEKNPAQNCPAFMERANSPEVKAMLDKLTEDAATAEKYGPAEQALHPEIICTTLDDQMTLYQELLKDMHLCPERPGSIQERENVAGSILSLRQRVQHIRCH